MATKKTKTIKVVRKREPLDIKLPKRKGTKSEDLVDAYIESVVQIRDLAQLFVMLPEGTRRGIAGERKLTMKEQHLLELIKKEQKRADKLLYYLKTQGE